MRTSHARLPLAVTILFCGTSSDRAVNVKWCTVGHYAWAGLSVMCQRSACCGIDLALRHVRRCKHNSLQRPRDLTLFLIVMSWRARLSSTQHSFYLSCSDVHASHCGDLLNALCVSDVAFSTFYVVHRN
jgi:hypothetical protein